MGLTYAYMGDRKYKISWENWKYMDQRKFEDGKAMEKII